MLAVKAVTRSRLVALKDTEVPAKRRAVVDGPETRGKRRKRALAFDRTCFWVWQEDKAAPLPDGLVAGVRMERGQIDPGALVVPDGVVGRDQVPTMLVRRSKDEVPTELRGPAHVLHGVPDVVEATGDAGAGSSQHSYEDKGGRCHRRRELAHGGGDRINTGHEGLQSSVPTNFDDENHRVLRELSSPWETMGDGTPRRR